jgi:ATP-binding cassette subfamily B protein
MICYIFETIRHDALIFFEHTYGIGFVLDAAEKGKSFEEVLHFMLLMFAVLAIGGFVSGYVVEYVEIKALPKIQYNLKQLLYQKAAELDVACYDNPDYYNDFILAASEADKVIGRTTQLLKFIVGGITILLTNGGYFLSRDIFAVAIIMLSFLLRLFIAGVINKLNYRVRLEENAIERRRSYIHRVFYLNEYAKELRLNKDVSKKLYADFDKSNHEIYQINKEVAKKRFTLTLLRNYFCNDFLLDVGYISYLVYRAAVVRAISYSNVVVLFNSSRRLRNGFDTLSGVLPWAMETSLYVGKIRTFLSYETKITSSKNLPVPKEPGAIRIKDVSFSYQEKRILNSITMNIGACEKIALVGYNGAGKTTLIKLLMRLYDADSGEISLGGIDIRDFNVKEYRERIGAVFQDYRLYAATVEENILLDLHETGDKSRLLSSLDSSGFTQKLRELKDGLSTPLTREFEENGEDLSGGEKQKLAIARVFYKDAGLIILDEPSSALDPIAEYNLNRSLMEITKNKTVIFISHRLSTTRFADKICMMENGQIIEEGSHNSLLEMNGKYAQMWRAQAGRYQ